MIVYLIDTIIWNLKETIMLILIMGIITTILAMLYKNKMTDENDEIFLDENGEMDIEKFVAYILDEETRKKREKKRKKIDEIFSYILALPINFITIIVIVFHTFAPYNMEKIEKLYFYELVKLYFGEFGLFGGRIIAYALLSLILCLMCLLFRRLTKLNLDRSTFFLSAFKVQFYLLISAFFSFFLELILYKL